MECETATCNQWMRAPFHRSNLQTHCKSAPAYQVRIDVIEPSAATSCHPTCKCPLQPTRVRACYVNSIQVDWVDAKNVLVCFCDDRFSCSVQHLHFWSTCCSVFFVPNKQLVRRRQHVQIYPLNGPGDLSNIERVTLACPRFCSCTE